MDSASVNSGTIAIINYYSGSVAKMSSFESETLKGYILSTYTEYQSRYSTNIRESDRILLAIIHEISTITNLSTALDIGCNTGNLLFHAKRLFPDLQLMGGDIFPEIIEVCKNNSL